MFYHSINNFRAIAIVLIVFSHSWWISGLALSSTETVIERLWVLISFGGTFLFVFISGFLFQSLNVFRFSYGKILILKSKRLLIPYFVLSMPIISAAVYFKIPHSEFFSNDSPVVWFNYIRPALVFFATGAAITAYWYIPFIFSVFLLSPLWVVFSRQEVRIQLLIISISMVASGFSHRSIGNLNVIQSIIYFIPLFLLGMVCSKYSKEITSRFSRYGWVILIFSVGMSFVNSYYSGVLTNLEKNLFEYNGYDFKVVEKALQSVALFLVLDKYLNFENKVLNILAESSFCIFFMHTIVIAIVNRVLKDSFSGFLYWNILSLSVICVCISFGYIIKIFFKEKSKYIIGW